MCLFAKKSFTLPFVTTLLSSTVIFRRLNNHVERPPQPKETFL